MTCPLRRPRRALRTGALPVLNAPAGAGLRVCGQDFTSFAPEEIPLYQRHPHGSLGWELSYARRGYTVEQFNAHVKNTARECLVRGRIRVRGIIKTGLLVAFAVASTNRRLALSFARRMAQPPRPKRTRRPRPRADRFSEYRLVAERAQRSETVLTDP